MEELEKIITEIEEDICDIEVDYYGRKLAVGVSTGKVYLFDNINGKMTKITEVLSHTGPVFKVGWSHPSFGPVLATCGFDKKVNLFKIDPNGGFEKIYEHEMHDNCVRALKFCPSSNDLIFVSGCLNGNIIICKYFDKNFLSEKASAHDFGVNSIDFLDDKTFVTCGNDNTIKIWSFTQNEGNIVIKNDHILKDIDCVTRDVSCKDNKHFVSCGDDGNVYYWILSDDNKWAFHKIFSSENNNKLEKIRFNEEHTSIVVIDDTGKEHIIIESEINLSNA